MSDVLIYINVGGPHGIGHFARSYKIAEQLEANGYTPHFTGSIADEFKPIISSRFKLFHKDTNKFESIVIDAISISKKFQSEIRNKNKVILISPISCSYDYATHICLREPLSILEKVKNKKCFIDPYFAFSGCETKSKASFRIKNKYNMGICISGSEQYVNIPKLLSGLLTKKCFKSIKVVSNKNDTIASQYAELIIYKQFVQDIWKFFDNIDVFITGDGKMLYEAISRRIPTLSFCRDSHSTKNKYFADRLFINVEQKDWYKDEVFDVITDVKLMRTIIENISHANIDQKVQNLGNTILSIIEEGNCHEQYHC